MNYWEIIEDANLISKLISQGTIHITNNKGQNLLMLAVSKNCLRTAKLLLESGINVNNVDRENNRTALMFSQTLAAMSPNEKYKYRQLECTLLA